MLVSVAILLALAMAQMKYLKQAVLHLKLDNASKVRLLLKTTTEVVAGGMRLASAAWRQDVTEFFSAIGDIKNAAADYKKQKTKPW